MFFPPSAQGRRRFAPSGSIGLVGPEDLSSLFATTLYTGTATAGEVVTGVDLASTGGLVWNKGRSASSSHFLFDTLRGPNAYLQTNSTSYQYTATDFLSAFTTKGVTLGSSAYNVNKSGLSYVLWSFRRAPGFFDVVSYTGTGVAGTLIAHGLKTAPAFILLRNTSSEANWVAWHKGVAAGVNSVEFNTTNAWQSQGQFLGTEHTRAVFQGGSQAYYANQSGVPYIAYLWADAPRLIAAGTYVGTGSATPLSVTCGTGWDPQWLMIRRVSGGNTLIYDRVRQQARGAGPCELAANTTGIEGGQGTAPDPVLAAPGFTLTTTWEGLNASGASYAYLAIRASEFQ
ncbi:DUF7483 domain-containing protein [Pararhodospirillum photometricum]|nr:hypothetical protein [Pararhodospirillum photometricum]